MKISSIKCQRGVAVRWANPLDKSKEIIVMAETVDDLKLLYSHFWPESAEPFAGNKQVEAILFTVDGLTGEVS